MDYTIEHKDTDEEYNVCFGSSWIAGYPTFEEAKAAIKRMKQLDREEQDRDCYSFVGPAKSPSNVWDSVYWAD